MKKSIREHREMLLRTHRERVAQIRNRLRDFRQIPEEEYPYELIYCLLTPQSSARNADAVVRKLKEEHFVHQPFDTEALLRDPSHYIRFHKTKARRLEKVVAIFPEVMTCLKQETSSQDHRSWLVKHIDGFGMKEATHFLRNIGRNDGLAILDRHILRHLVRSGVLPELPKSVTPNQYTTIEKRFTRFAKNIGIPIDELDLLFWSLETGEILK